MPTKRTRKRTIKPQHYNRARKLREDAMPSVSFGWYNRLTEGRRRFVDEYLIDLNGHAAAMRAGWKNGGSAYDILDREDVQQAIRERREMLDAERGIGGARTVLNRLWNIATADPRELVEIRKVPCRYCHGINGQYQFTKTEMDRQLKAYQYGQANHPSAALWPFGSPEQAAYEAGKAGLPFDEQGGEGYTTARSPNEACSECAGLGVPVQVIHDTRYLSDAGRSIYRGAVYSAKDGKFEIKIANQDAARDALCRHYGVAVERKMLMVKTIDPAALDEDELTQAIAELEALTLARDEYTEMHNDVPAARPRLRLTRPE